MTGMVVIITGMRVSWRFCQKRFGNCVIVATESYSKAILMRMSALIFSVGGFQETFPSGPMRMVFCFYPFSQRTNLSI